MISELLCELSVERDFEAFLVAMPASVSGEENDGSPEMFSTFLELRPKVSLLLLVSTPSKQKQKSEVGSAYALKPLEPVECT